MKTKYNYVIFGSGQENYLYSFQDIKKLDNAVYIHDINAILGWKKSFFYAHISKKGNSLFLLPFKSLWNRYLFKDNPFNDEKPLCFIFFGIWENLIAVAGFGDYLKSHFEGSKTVLFLQDILAKSHNLYSKEHYNASELRQLYDYVVSYDKGDCKNYGFIYHPTVFSVPCLPKENNYPESDIYFLGLAKNRFPQLIEIYNDLSRGGLKCDFFVAGVPNDLQIRLDGMHYISHMPYTENLQRICKTKCILELMQEGAQGYTFRLWEAIVMNKKLLSDNHALLDSPYYDANCIKFYNSYNRDVRRIINWILDKKHFYSYDNLVNKISPKEFLIFLDNIISTDE